MCGFFFLYFEVISTKNCIINWIKDSHKLCKTKQTRGGGGDREEVKVGSEDRWGRVRDRDKEIRITSNHPWSPNSRVRMTSIEKIQNVLLHNLINLLAHGKHRPATTDAAL